MDDSLILTRLHLDLAYATFIFEVRLYEGLNTA
jgi:hypothetical protein